MMKTSGSDMWTALVARGPAAVKRWLADVEPGQQPSSQRIDWLGLAELAASKARAQLDLEWADIALAIYEPLARKMDRQSRKESLMYSAMNLRAFLITRLGATEGQPILDPQAIVNWFFDNLATSFDQASTDAAHWRTLDIQRVRELRWIKNRLAPIKLLMDSGTCPRDSCPELNRWLRIRSQLP